MKINKRIFLIFFLILLSYILFPNNNSSLDAYAYAAEIKYRTELFRPHHLLYNYFVYTVDKILIFFSIDIDILLLGKYINNVFQIVNLVIIYKILRLSKLSLNSTIIYIIFLSFCFNPWRYGTENEAYIIPITFSLLSSLYFIKYLKENRINSVISAGFFSALACLFHQLHVFWWLFLMIGYLKKSRSLKTFFAYMLPALIVPVVYVLVIYYYNNLSLTRDNILHFVFKEFYKGTVSMNYSTTTIFLQIISMIRVFVQAHPIIYYLIKYDYIYALPLLVSLYFLFNAIKWAFKNYTIIKRSLNSDDKLFSLIHLLIGVAYVLVAFLSMGNVEFMVMLPFLLIISVAINYQINNKLILYVSCFLFVWNFYYGILPNYLYKFYNDDKLISYIEKNKEAFFLVKSRVTINKYFYKTGIDNPTNVKYGENIDRSNVEYILYSERKIYTDIIDYPEIFNRQKITESKNAKYLFQYYNYRKAFNYETFFGKATVYEVLK